MSEAARYESEIERLKARAELLQDAVEGNAAAVIANRRMKHDLNNNITKVQGAVQVLAIRLASERKLTPDEERLVSMAERVPHL